MKMTVKQLIEELKKLDPDLEVQTEGCDCDSSVDMVVVDEHSGQKFAYLKRP